MKETELNYGRKNASYVFNIIDNRNILFYVNNYVHEILKLVGFIFVCRFSGFEKCQNDEKLNFFLLPTKVGNYLPYFQPIGHQHVSTST